MFSDGCRKKQSIIKTIWLSKDKPEGASEDFAIVNRAPFLAFSSFESSHVISQSSLSPLLYAARFSIDCCHTSNHKEKTISIYSFYFFNLSTLIPRLSGKDFGDELKDLQSTLDDYEDLVSSLAKSKKVRSTFL
jgi:hypothetical protein